MVAKYTIGDESLTVCLLNADKVAAEVKQGKLKGRLGYSSWGGVTVTESSKKIFNLLNSPTNKDLFSCLGELRKAPVS